MTFIETIELAKQNLVMKIRGGRIIYVIRPIEREPTLKR